MQLKKIYPTYFIILPFTVYFAFFIFPSILGFGYAFTDYSLYSSKINFIGIENFINISTDSYFGVALKNTLVFTAFTSSAKIIFGIILALILNTSIRTKNALRTINFLPQIINNLIIGLIFTSIFNPDKGILNQAFGLFNLVSFQKDWLGSPFYAMMMVNFVDVWKGTGFCMVVYLAALQVIPVEYYESCNIDGANAWQKFKNITIPMILPSISVTITLNIIWGLKVFDIIIALTNGGPGKSTEVLNTAIYKEYGQGLYGSATAIGLVLFVFVFLIAGIVNRLFRRLEVEL